MGRVSVLAVESTGSRFSSAPPERSCRTARRRPHESACRQGCARDRCELGDHEDVGYVMAREGDASGWALDGSSSAGTRRGRQLLQRGLTVARCLLGRHDESRRCSTRGRGDHSALGPVIHGLFNNVGDAVRPNGSPVEQLEDFEATLRLSLTSARACDVTPPASTTKRSPASPGASPKTRRAQRGLSPASHSARPGQTRTARRSPARQ